MILAHINYLSTFVAALAAWLFGAAYYGPLGKTWLEAQGRTMEEHRKAMAEKSALQNAAPFIVSLVCFQIMAWVLYGVITHLGYTSIRGGIISGLFVWFGFVLTTMIVNNGFAGRRVKLTVIDAGHWLGVLLIMGAVIGWFGA